MSRTYQLIKLRSDTVNHLKRLKLEMYQGGLDGLVNSMIQITDAYRLQLKETGWNSKG